MLHKELPALLVEFFLQVLLEDLFSALEGLAQAPQVLLSLGNDGQHQEMRKLSSFTQSFPKRARRVLRFNSVIHGDWETFKRRVGRAEEHATHLNLDVLLGRLHELLFADAAVAVAVRGLELLLQPQVIGLRKKGFKTGGSID